MAFFFGEKKKRVSVVLTAVLFCFILVPTTAESEPSSETELLWYAASDMMEEMPEMTLTYGSALTGTRTEQEFQQLGDQLAGQFGITQSSILEESGRTLFKGETNLPGGTPLMLRLAELDSGDAYMFISLTFLSETDPSLIQETQQLVENKLSSLGLSPERRMMLRGEITPEILGDIPRKNGSLDQYKAESVLSRVAASLSATRLESYKDDQSRNVTLYSPHIKTRIQSGDNVVNVQAAVHQHSETGNWTLTLATPVITSDF